MELIYDKVADTLIIRWAKNKPATSIDINGIFWLRVVPDTYEVIGIEIENFKWFARRHFGEFAKLKK